MRWVYCVCFVGDRFVMVYNPSRKGWEMPGGRIEPGEQAEDAAIREVREECGCDMYPVASIERRDGGVFCGELVCSPSAKLRAEMRWNLFAELPSPLAFGEDEYTEILAWAKAKIAEQRADRGQRSIL